MFNTTLELGTAGVSWETPGDNAAIEVEETVWLTESNKFCVSLKCELGAQFVRAFPRSQLYRPRKIDNPGSKIEIKLIP